jgi:hypothetical protein
MRTYPALQRAMVKRRLLQPFKAKKRNQSEERIRRTMLRIWALKILEMRLPLRKA